MSTEPWYVFDNLLNLDIKLHLVWLIPIYLTDIFDIFPNVFINWHSAQRKYEYDAIFVIQKISV